jgi:predicted DNA-binding protein (MmcQ/YjbR family)
MAAPEQLTRAEAALRQHALTYPESYEEYPWGHRALKVKGKVFLFTAVVDDVLSLSVKLPLSGRVALTFRFASPTGYGLGKSGWVTAKFAATDDIPMHMFEEWIDESFRAIAPKKLLANLDQGEVEPPTKLRRKKKA